MATNNNITEMKHFFFYLYKKSFDNFTNKLNNKKRHTKRKVTYIQKTHDKIPGSIIYQDPGSLHDRKHKIALGRKRKKNI